MRRTTPLDRLTVVYHSDDIRNPLKVFEDANEYLLKFGYVNEIIMVTVIRAFHEEISKGVIEPLRWYDLLAREVDAYFEHWLSTDYQLINQYRREQEEISFMM